MQQQLSGSENATTPGGLGRRSTPGHQERSLGSFCESKNKEIVEKKQQAGSQQGAAGVNTILIFLSTLYQPHEGHSSMPISGV